MSPTPRRGLSRRALARDRPTDDGLWRHFPRGVELDRTRPAMSAAPNASAMTPEQRDAAFAMAGQEMEYRVELFNRLVGACYEKCIDKKFKEGDLNVGENSCVDRCAAKYWESVAIVGQMLGAQGGAQGGR